MGTQVLAGVKATYIGPPSDENWEKHVGQECEVTFDTCMEAVIGKTFEYELEQVEFELGV